MSHITTLYADPGVNQPIAIRKARNADIVFRFVDANAAAYNLADTFRMDIYATEEDETPILQLTEAAGSLGRSGHELTAHFTESNSDLDYRKVYYEIFNVTQGENWLQGDAEIIHGKSPEDGTTTVTRTINVAGNTVTCTINLVAQTGEVLVEPIDTELTFDRDKEFETVLGGTTTFTLAASGHNNGVGIIARINTPVAVNFPAGFEAVNGSDTIDTTKMNIIVFRYYSDYDGAGNAKVLYVIKNQTAV